MISEIRHALQLLFKNPLFALVAIVTLALGIGATTAVFTLVNALLIRPLPYQDPARLVLLFEYFKAQHLDAIPVSPPEFLEYKKEIRSFDKLAAFETATYNLVEGDTPERGALIGAGTILGLIVALLSTSVLRSVLYEVSALDLPTFLFVTLALALVLLIASYIPARRAPRADPMVALGRG